MNKLCHSESIVGKSFDYWKNIYNQGIIDLHAIHLRLNHLTYALNRNLITNEEYFKYRLNLTDDYIPSNMDYKPCSLMDFSKALKRHHLMDNLERNKPLIIDKQSKELTYKVQNNIINNFENINQQNKKIVGVHEYNLNKEQESNNDQTEMPKKSRKKRKRKKKNNNDFKNINHFKTVIINNTKDECNKKMKNSIVTSKKAVQIFIRKTNNQDKSQIDRKKSLVSTHRSVRDMFSEILKQFKKERQ
ncbi:putative uncharacterized protein DDB_G0282499 [Melanaphis sacchari]|uniref:putative uncharacterized protein DDB_G0282499 n=1 Tax=Melanaphis sacchari TaxID=742174 RepID=UPI000DC13227|nr:putative uncharacterized protein DDB_G0282499 [Melanaphis sacchari]